MFMFMLKKDNQGHSYDKEHLCFCREAAHSCYTLTCNMIHFKGVVILCCVLSLARLSTLMSRARIERGVQGVPVSYVHSFISLNSTLSRVKRQECDSTCDNGDCISYDNMCDGTVNCADGSDETMARCSGLICPPFLFRCDYGPCLSADVLCNGVKDCADNSDETQPQCSTCRSSEYRCSNGECIDSASLCNGKKDCTDGSDETKRECGNTVCTQFVFQCNYGPCLDRSVVCDGVDDCADRSDEIGCRTSKPPPPKRRTTSRTSTSTAPPASNKPNNGGCNLLNHPPNGQFKLHNNEIYSPNHPVPDDVEIQLICNSGYRAVGIYRGGKLYCRRGEWIGDNISEDVCQRTCPPINDPTIEASCTYKAERVNCSEAVEGTVAITPCIPFYIYGTIRNRMRCRKGQWTPNLGSCVPECGVKRVGVQRLIIGGTPTLKGEYPWMIAIYRRYEFVCGGSLISRKYVLSAAHCVTNEGTGDPHNKNEFTVIAGKYHRLYNDRRDTDSQQVRNVDRLIVHEHYRGRNQNYRHDIALLEVRDFKLDYHVQPACVDWEKEYDSIILKRGNTGVVSGWGNTEEGGDPASDLQKLIVPIENEAVCKQYLPNDFYQVYYTSDKLCAGYVNNGSTVCNGDSGSGYYFQSNSLYYVRAIVSISPTSKVGCDKNIYALYTKLSDYVDWVADKTDKLM